MVLKHDFRNFPELSNAQMQIFYFDSPHKQVPEQFFAKVEKVTDGDTIRISWTERDFDFPVRIADLAAPELDENGGESSQSFLENQILGKEVEIILSRSRVEKWGRLLASVLFGGTNMRDIIIMNGHGVPWSERKQ